MITTSRTSSLNPSLWSHRVIYLRFIWPTWPPVRFSCRESPSGAVTVLTTAHHKSHFKPSKMLYWQVQGWAPFLTQRLGWKSQAVDWDDLIPFPRAGRGQAHLLCQEDCGLWTEFPYPGDVQAHRDKWKLILAKPSLWTQVQVHFN